MKKLITNYVFNASSKTITFSDYVTIKLESILIVTNVTKNSILYTFASGGKGGSVTGNVLTLQGSTSGMSNSDKLQIYYDDPNHIATDTSGNVLVNLATQIAGEDAGNNALRTEGTSKLVTGSAGAVNEDAIPSTEVLADGFGRFSLQIIGTWSGSLLVSCSNDNQNFVNTTVFNSASTNALSAASITTNGVYYGYINYKYIRVRMATYTSGTATAILALSSTAGGQATIGTLAAQSGVWSIHPAISGSSAVTSVASDTNAVTLLASNTNRKQAFIYNDSTAAMFVKFGASATSSSFTVKLAANTAYILPTPPIYSGVITAAWEAANGSARVTEVT
jgi:hypothetical protein